MRGHTNKGTVHYWNKIDDAWIDTTRSQFGPEEYIINYTESPEKSLWWFQDTEEKYWRLLERVEGWLIRT